eukprot:TRINITY_DN26727_c0_g1_i1.p1 TRINITY_DN26727_c0_g1~~TRINITY_DN26727_c0_g1_i1.p1  ORF type:complete len:269 (-),score=22.97 TRINITY_DN26727_c0_g1_i1:501-1307(-)
MASLTGSGCASGINIVESTVASAPSCNNGITRVLDGKFSRRRRQFVSVRKSGSLRNGPRLRVVAAEKETKDTRIFYDSKTEGWLGYPSSSPSYPEASAGVPQRLPSDFLLLSQTESHYRYMGITSDADVQEIKSAFRRLSKQYHPDSTNLPLEVAAQKFVRLKEAHSVLTNPEKRRLYDWQLAQIVDSGLGNGRYVWPYEVDASQGGSNSAQKKRAQAAQQRRDDEETVGNKPLSSQAVSALAFDAFALSISLLTIIYVLVFKNKGGS